jgi:hypothetical protein
MLRRSLPLSALALAAALLSACATGPVVPPGFSASLDRSICFGACPDYAVTVRGDGSVRYVGRNFVLERGERTGRADPADVARLRAMIRQAGFFALRDEYRARATDLPTSTVAVEDEGRVKTVIDYGGDLVGMPAAVRQIQDEIDRVAGTARWIRGEGPDGAPPPK